MEATVKALKEHSNKQEKELVKKEEQIEILLEQIKYLKNVIAESKSKKSSKEISSYEEPVTSKSTHSEEGPLRPAPVVGGYFGSVFNWLIIYCFALDLMLPPASLCVYVNR